jgi:DNA-binding LacI/PurR family transcriptional regulator
VPEDVSIITFEDSNVTPFLTPPHTTISQNIEVFAKEIANMGIEVSKNGDVKKNVVLENKLIIRETVKNLK